MRSAAARVRACAALILLAFAGGAVAQEPDPTPEAAASQLHFRVGWPEGIVYEVRKASPALHDVGPLSWFEEVYLRGRVGVRLDVDGAAFLADESLSDFNDDVTLRRARFYLLGAFRFGVPLAYRFEFSIEGSRVYLNDFYVRLRPPRWVDAIDVGYMTPPMGLENIVSSRSLSLMEMAAPVQAMAPGFRSGVAASGHSDPRRLAWQAGFFSAGQEQVSGDASKAALQVIGRIAGVPWRQADDEGASFLHLGVSAGYVFSSNSVRYRARPESFVAPYMVDTGDTSARSAVQTCFEGAWVDGPLQVSGEMLQSLIDAGGGEQYLYGLYGMTSWVLTGEHRRYDRATGMFERLVPSHPVTLHGGWGAFEIAQRFSWLDLTSGSVHGGQLLDFTSGVTWHLNTQLRLFANYGLAHAADGPQSGRVHIFQARVELGI